MTTADTKTLERLDQLEARVAEAARIIDQLSTRSRTLTDKNLRLEEEITRLKAEKQQLSKQLEELASRKNAGTFEREKIIRTIDRMIEKFGELQV